jgi:hypothetical protein
MAIHRMLQGMTFDESAVESMSGAASEATLVELGLTNPGSQQDHRPLPNEGRDPETALRNRAEKDSELSSRQCR